MVASSKACNKNNQSLVFYDSIDFVEMSKELNTFYIYSFRLRANKNLSCFSGGEKVIREISTADAGRAAEAEWRKTRSGWSATSLSNDNNKSHNTR